MKINLLLVGFLTLCTLGVKAEVHPDLLVFWAKDGSKPSFVLNEKPRVTFTATDLMVTTADTEVRYPLSQLVKWTYEKKAVTGVTDLSLGEKLPKLTNNALFFPFLKEQTSVSVYTVAGTLLLEHRTTTAGPYAIALDAWQKGTYLVCVDGVTYKITKR